MKRLIIAMENVQYENEKLYKDVSLCIEKIENVLNNISNKISDNLDEDSKNYICNNIENIKGIAKDIYNYSVNAKQNGIYNEDQLKIGKNQINELEKILDDLSEKLNDINDFNGQLSDQIYDIEIKINDIKEELKNKSNNLNIESKLKKHNKKYTWICDAHNEMISQTDNIEMICNNFNFDNYHKNIELLNTSIATIKDALYQCYTLNQNMGNSINKKNEIIQDLEDQIYNIENEIEDNEISKNDLEDKIVELNDILLELENKLKQ